MVEQCVRLVHDERLHIVPAKEALGILVQERRRRHQHVRRDGRTRHVRRRLSAGAQLGEIVVQMRGVRWLGRAGDAQLVRCVMAECLGNVGNLPCKLMRRRKHERAR